MSGERSAARPGCTLPPGKTRYPSYRRLGGPQGQSGRAENLVPTGIRSHAVQPVVSCYTDYTLVVIVIMTMMMMIQSPTVFDHCQADCCKSDRHSPQIKTNSVCHVVHQHQLLITVVLKSGLLISLVCACYCDKSIYCHAYHSFIHSIATCRM